MRKFIFPMLLFLAACGSKNDNKAGAKNENTDYLVSMEGIGAVKNDMSQAELEAVLQQKVPLANLTDTISGSWMDTATVNYKGAVLHLQFSRAYGFNAAVPDSFFMRLIEIKTEYARCKTAEGIGIGSTKQDIIDAYPENLLIMEPGYENDTTFNYSKTLYDIKIRKGWEGPQIICYLKNNKIYAFEVSSYFDDSE